jgi:putative copper resistance protein D
MNMSAMDMAPEWPAALLAWPAILAQTLIFGSALLCLMLNWSIAAHARTGDALARSLAGWWRILALIVALVSPLMFVNEVAGMAGVSMRGAIPLLGEVLTQTQSGHTWEWRLPAALALMIAAWLPLRESVQSLALVILCAVLGLAGSLKSHAIDFGTTAVALRFVHALAAGAWAGSLFGYWVGARPKDPDNRVRVEAAQVLSRMAVRSVLILIASGIYIAYEGLGHTLSHLFYSSYGRVLSIKVEAFALVLAIGAYNRFFLIPALERPSARLTLVRTVSAESLMIVGIIGLAALLSNTPPARMSMGMSMSEELLKSPKLFVSLKPRAVSDFPLVKMRASPGANLITVGARDARALEVNQ